MSPQLLRQILSPPESLRIVDTGSKRLSGHAPNGPIVRGAYGMSKVAGAVLPVLGARLREQTARRAAARHRRTLARRGRTVEHSEEGEPNIAGPIARGYPNQAEPRALCGLALHVALEVDGQPHRVFPMRLTLPHGPARGHLPPADAQYAAHPFRRPLELPSGVERQRHDVTPMPAQDDVHGQVVVVVDDRPLGVARLRV